ncbi:hypothetical protein FRC14_000432 [Serendipita sp. 396]|nr:hypothetical protein FRC14_000432 [Serendipita sp. 396]KAG8786496.1 hypothetical protein FRC15_011301 [Serendipita sp. 397]KAG8822568.1 hypothetical protein FRC19_005689 [Serendipita sp. 401]KAG8831663.1 hypothetical protein FRC18_006211 [Serendipita sp. 400]KAG8856510.1 hypothetical protein FRB91_000736 [Serendipita sp. 411]KAG8870934.1 hypothetical protein FRC20_011095 [Serendipita sp. 405]KAG9055080.1 hypothetical protein FS842_003232 [Serendipita sp. 407]
MALQVLEVHTPTKSLAIPHSLKGENISSLFSRLSSKLRSTVGPGWIKYEYNNSFWDLDDDADYSIFSWRLTPTDGSSPSPVIYVHDPLQPLPSPPSYQNPSYYTFRRVEGNPRSNTGTPRPSHTTPASVGGLQAAPSPERSVELASHADLHRHNTIIRHDAPARTRSIRSSKSHRSKRLSSTGEEEHHHEEVEQEKVPKYKKDFLKFHGENGNRVVVGTFGPVPNVEMLLKKGYRHVYMSRHFAKRHGLVPPEVAPGWFGYGGLVNMGQIPIKLGTKTTTHTVYLAEENQFDVVLGRSFMEARRVQTDPNDLSSVVCQDNGDSLDCRIIVIRDGRGDFVTVP